MFIRFLMVSLFLKNEGEKVMLTLTSHTKQWRETLKRASQQLPLCLIWMSSKSDEEMAPTIQSLTSTG